MDSNYVLGPDGELYHWGTKGMKWGIRRYQNKDGSLTPAGKKRYAAENERLKAREKAIKGQEKAAARQAKLDAKKAELDAREAALKGGKVATKPKDVANAAKPKTVKDMTDDELNKAVNRARLESEYARLHPKQESLMTKLGNKVLNEVLIPSVMSAGKSYLDKTLSAKMKDKEPTLDALLKKYGDMSEDQRKRYQNAAAVRTWENTILGKKNK